MKNSTKTLGILIIMLLFLTNLAISGTYVFPGNSLSGSFGAWGGTGYFYSPTFNVNATGGIDITYYDIDVSLFTEANVWSTKGVAEPGVSQQNTMTSIDPEHNSLWCNILNMEIASGVDFDGHSISTLGPDGVVRTSDDTRHQGTQDWYLKSTGGKIDGPAAGPYYNNESYVTPNLRHPSAPAKTASELNSWDFRLRILPTGTNTYTYEMWIRMHNSAAKEEGAYWVYNKAMNNLPPSGDAWVAFTANPDGTGPTVFAISDIDLSSVHVFMGLGNFQDPATQSLTWGRIEVTGTQLPPSEVWVDDNYTSSGTNDGHMWGYDAFDNIQDGVIGVVSGGLVHVAVGTYLEKNILINKGLTLQGAGKTTTFIDASGFSVSGNVVKIDLTSGNVLLDGFTIKTGDSLNGVYAGSTSSGSTITISHNRIEGFGPTATGDNFGLIAGYGSLASLVFTYNEIFNCGSNSILLERHVGPTDVSYNSFDRNHGDVSSDAYFNMNYGGAHITSLQKVSHNTIDMGVGTTFNNDTRGCGISFASSYTGTLGGFTNVQITDNTIFNLKPYRRGIGMWNNAPAGSGSIGNINAPLIARNTIKGMAGNTGSYGIRLLGLVTNASITNNWVDSVETSFRGQALNGHICTGTSVSHNSFTSIWLNLDWQGVSTLDASCNWWGDNTPTGVTSKIHGPVDYTPWLHDGADMSGDPGFQPNLSYLHVDDNSPQTGTTGRIQEGIDAVAPAGTVNVLKGTYNENIVISKPLTLLGAGRDSVLVYPAVSDIGMPDPQQPPSFRGSQMCVVQASNVTIDGFTFDGDSPTLTPLGTIDARNGIITNYGLGDWSNLKVQNCTVKNIYLRGIYASAQTPNNLTGVDFNHNIVSNVKGWSMQSAGLMLWGSSGTVSQNQISNTSLGVFYHNYSDGTIMWNTVANSEVCLGVNSNDSPTSVSYNNVNGSSQGIQTISTLAPINVTFNNVTDCRTGVVLYGGGTAQVNLWDDTIKGLNTYATYGVYASTNLDPWGLGELHANLKRNIIKDNYDGIVLNEPSGDRSKTLSVLIGGASADRNFIYNNTNYELLLEYCNDNQTATYNYWGKSTYAQIEEVIYHKVDQPDLGLVTFNPAILHGDVNLDSKLSVADVVYLINYLFKGGPPPELFIVADVNRDGALTVADAIYLINYLFKGGPAPKIIVSEPAEAGIGKIVVDKPKLGKPVNLHSVEK